MRSLASEAARRLGILTQPPKLWWKFIASGIHLENKSSMLHAFAPCIYTDMQWAMKLCEKLSPYFHCADVQRVQGRSRDTVCPPSTKAVPWSLCPLSAFAVLLLMAVQGVVGVPTCKGDEVPLWSSVTQKIPWGSWIALGLLTVACAIIKCGVFFSWR